jgi:transcriptional regulator with XRE-family HTH domain
MRQTLDNQLAVFLHKTRGQITYAAFARKLGITPSGLFRFENCQQSITLKTLQEIMDQLKCSWADIFPGQGCCGGGCVPGATGETHNSPHFRRENL